MFVFYVFRATPCLRLLGRSELATPDGFYPSFLPSMVKKKCEAAPPKKGKAVSVRSTVKVAKAEGLKQLWQVAPTMTRGSKRIMQDEQKTIADDKKETKKKRRKISGLS